MSAQRFGPIGAGEDAEQILTEKVVDDGEIAGEFGCDKGVGIACGRIGEGAVERVPGVLWLIPGRGFEQVGDAGLWLGAFLTAWEVRFNLTPFQAGA